MDEFKANRVIQSSRTKVLDHTVLLSVVDGDVNLLRLVCGVFLRTYPAVLAEIGDAIAVNDGEALARAAHKLKGSAGFFVTEVTRLLLSDLEMIGLGGDLTNASSRLLDLVTEMQLLEPELLALAEGEPASQND